MPSNRRTTLKDIAAEAGCSAAVVSTVLNGAKGTSLVSKRTRAMIEEIAARLNYRPNFASRSLKLSCSRTLGIYVASAPWHQLSNIYEMQVFRGIERAAREREYDLLLINLGEKVAPQICAEKIVEHRVDGVLLIHAPIGAPWIDELLALSSNVVAIDYSVPHDGLDATMFDNRAAVETALDYLFGLGHRRIGFIGTCQEEAEHDPLERQNTFCRSMAERCGEFDRRLLFSPAVCDRRIRADEPGCQLDGICGAEYFLLSNLKPTAIIGYNDLVAIEAMYRLQDAGYVVPEQISIMGIDDSERCRYARPMLTTVYHPMEEMGYHAAMRLIDKSEQRGTLPPDVYRKCFSPHLVERKSVASPVL